MCRLLIVILLVAPSLLTAQAAPETVVLSRSLIVSRQGASAPAIPEDAIRMPEPSPHGLRNALIGGVIGAAAGAIVCTVISNIADDAAVDRFTTCTAKGYLLTGSIGFGAGFLVGWLGSS